MMIISLIKGLSQSTPFENYIANIKDSKNVCLQKRI